MAVNIIDRGTGWVPPRWDRTADHVVVGFGGSGATYAATAAGLGEDVLVLEKAEQGGGNSVCVAGSLLHQGLPSSARAAPPVTGNTKRRISLPEQPKAGWQ